MAVTGCRTAAYIYSQVINTLSQKPQSKNKRPLKTVSNKKREENDGGILEVVQRWLLNAVKLTVTAAKSMMQPGGGGGPGGEGFPGQIDTVTGCSSSSVLFPTSSQRRYGKCETARSWAVLLASLICVLIAHLRTFGSLLYPTCAHEPRHTASFIPDDRDKPWPTGETSTPPPWLCEIDVRRPMFRYTMLVRHIQVALI